MFLVCESILLSILTLFTMFPDAPLSLNVNDDFCVLGRRYSDQYNKKSYNECEQKDGSLKTVHKKCPFDLSFYFDHQVCFQRSHSFDPNLLSSFKTFRNVVG